MELVKGVLAGDRRAIARAISVVEGGAAPARNLLTALYLHTGRAHVVGVTGAPGAGKSTLIEQLVRAYRKQGARAGVVAVDPTSPFTGGALLGDRVRMRDLAGDAGVFIRSMATRGAVGGLAQATDGAVQILDAAGYEIIWIETVGAGQDEVEIAQMAHTTVVVQTPGLGDEIQALKAGLLEIADVLVVNKADQAGADQVVRDLEDMLQRRQQAAGWTPPVCKTVAIDGTGISEAVGAVQAHRAYLAQEDRRQAREAAYARARLEAALRAELASLFLAHLPAGAMDRAVARIAARSLAPYEALQALGLYDLFDDPVES